MKSFFWDFPKYSEDFEKFLRGFEKYKKKLKRFKGFWKGHKREERLYFNWYSEILKKSRHFLNSFMDAKKN